MLTEITVMITVWYCWTFAGSLRRRRLWRVESPDQDQSQGESVGSGDSAGRCAAGAIPADAVSANQLLPGLRGGGGEEVEGGEEVGGRITQTHTSFIKIGTRCSFPTRATHLRSVLEHLRVFAVHRRANIEQLTTIDTLICPRRRSKLDDHRVKCLI